MKILISNALWGEGYCSIFTKYSLATLLSPANIPKLAERCELTFHIITTRRDRRRLLRDPALAEAKRYGAIEWELIEDFIPHSPPVGPGGEKYPFLSALQNIAIRRSIDHDAIVFNYADFIWADGSLANAVDMLRGDDELRDAVFAFCLPVDRDLGVRALEQHRRSDRPDVVDLAPRNGARIAAECIHREAKIRFWEEAPRFTNLPSYLIWRVGDQGLLIRSYHQSILAMRVRRDDPQYLQGILRGSLDSSFGAQLAEKTSLAFATDTDRVLVFSLYHTPVDSRVPLGVTREMSLRSLLTGDVTPAQRPFAERPIFLRLRDGDEALWSETAAKSWQVLQHAQGTTRFDQAVYDKNLETHGVVPKLERMGLLRRRVLPPLNRLVHPLAAGMRQPSGLIGRIVDVLRHPALLRAAITKRYPLLHRGFLLLRHPRQLREALQRRLELRGIAVRDQLVSHFLQSFGLRRGSYIAPQVWVARANARRYYRALGVESRAAEMTDAAHLQSTLRNAEALLRETIKSTPVWLPPVQALGRNLWFQGRFREAMQAFVMAEQLRDVMAWVARWPIDSCVFLPRNCAESIGLMGHLDAFAKHKILTADPRPYYLLAPPRQVVNGAFLDYWKDHISVVSDLREIDRLASREAIYTVNWNWVMPKDGAIAFVHAGMAAVHRAWEAAGRAPLLRLRDDHAAALCKARREWGMADSDRFVCLHVRTAGFYGENREKAQLFRNTSIADYYPLIRALTDMGLWIVRMGDRSMPPLDLGQCGAPQRVVDYALTPQKCGELDVALCANCELFVSSPSGLHTVAHAFGRPVCEVNYPIYNGFPWHPGDIFVPQLYFSRAKGRSLTLQEILGSDLVHHDHQFLLEQAGISLIPNEPDDIVETVMEALAPKSYRVQQAALAERVCATFDELNRQHDVGISGRLGRYFAMKYARQLLPAPHPTANGYPGPQPDDEDVQDRAPTSTRLPKRKLDILIPCFNRPRYLHRILETGLQLAVPGVHFVVFDDASDAPEDVPGLGMATTERVCRSFSDDRVIYTRNPTNMGVAKSLTRYYAELCGAEYTSLLNPKDEFISAAPIISALAKLDADPKLSFVVYPLRQVDRSDTDKPLLFNYSRMSGREFVAAHVRDPMLQHCSGYAILRVEALRRCGIPRDLDLRAYGLEDASGIDHEMIFNLATTGDVEFEREAPVRRTIVDGYTERFPLTFAYSQYQYARRLVAELEPRGFLSAETRRLYLGFWHLIMARGLVVAYRPVHGSEQERGVRRIRPHLPMPILLYLPMEAGRFRVWPRLETLSTYLLGARLLLGDWWKKICGRPHIC